MGQTCYVKNSCDNNLRIFVYVTITYREPFEMGQTCYARNLRKKSTRTSLVAGLHRLIHSFVFDSIILLLMKYLVVGTAEYIPRTWLARFPAGETF